MRTWRRLKRILTYVNVILKGFLFGIANIIPGMSGGTLALVLGIYERLIKALHNINPKTAQKLLLVITLNQRAISEARTELRRVDFGFLVLLGTGAVIAIAATSRFLIYLVNEKHDPAYGFFSGLILTSIIIPIRMLKSFGWKQVIALLISAALTFGISMGMGEKYLEKEKRKLGLQIEEGPGRLTPIPSELDNSSVGRHVRLFLCGAMSISAMILPGISGAFVLLIFGAYFDILAAINDFELLALTTFAVGCAIGLLLFARLLNYVLQNFYDLTVSFLIGLMIGSLYGLWPFRNYEIVAGERIDVNHIMPQADSNLLITALAFLVSCGLILLCCRFEKTESL